jgi:hypothetical protein
MTRQTKLDDYLLIRKKVMLHVKRVVRASEWSLRCFERSRIEEVFKQLADKGLGRVVHTNGGFKFERALIDTDNQAAAEQVCAEVDISFALYSSNLREGLPTDISADSVSESVTSSQRTNDT